jgi:hypothetical protein
VTEAFKFLRPGRVAPFTGAVWPAPGEWLDGGADGVHAIQADALAIWIAEELWRVELDGAAPVAPGVLGGRRGRLVSRVEEWTDGTARDFARACAAHVRGAPAGRAAEYAADAAADAEGARADSTATLVGYMAARAVAAAGPGTLTAERRRQSLWLAERLGLR